MFGLYSIGWQCHIVAIIRSFIATWMQDFVLVFFKFYFLYREFGIAVALRHILVIVRLAYGLESHWRVIFFIMIYFSSKWFSHIFLYFVSVFFSPSVLDRSMTVIWIVIIGQMNFFLSLSYIYIQYINRIGWIGPFTSR